MQSLLFPEFSPGDLEQRALSEWADRWLKQFPVLSPGDDALATSSLVLRRISTQLGPMLAVCAPMPTSDPAGGLVLLEFIDEERIEAQLDRATKVHASPMLRCERGSCTELDEVEDQVHAYFAGERQSFELRLAPTGTPFQTDVWSELVKIPYGAQVSYGHIAQQLNRPSATRAVGAANGRNPIAIIQPCHRVVGADGTLTGYAGGLWRKRRLIELEAQHGLRDAPAARRDG
jgi:O-6-methylguanine DNA methyltransferase